MHSYFAAHGYASVRVDVRGSGDSDGRLEDEYLKLEQDDALEAIAWIAAQDWCDGAVAIIGKSWGGFNALQIAARRPPRSRRSFQFVSPTIATLTTSTTWAAVCSTTISGGGRRCLPIKRDRPIPHRRRTLAGDVARSDRMMPFWPALWLRHQRRDAYWKHGSVCEDWSAIDVPTLAIGGWADGYSNAVSRLVANIKTPALGIVGPWAHLYPHNRATRAGDRIPPGGRAIPRPLAAGTGNRGHAHAKTARLHRGVERAVVMAGPGTGEVGRRGELALAV